VGGTEVHRSGDGRLPVFAGERAAGPLGQRTLVLEVVNGEVTGSLRGATGGTVLETSTITDARQLQGFGPQRRPVALDAADTALAEAVGRLTGEGSGDAGAALADLGVGFVVLAGDQDDEVQEAARSVSGATGLTRLGVADQGMLWQVTTATGADGDGDPSTGEAGEEVTATSAEVSRVRVLDADGTSTPVEVVDGEARVPQGTGTGDRVLVLAERTGVTTAHVDGRALPQAEAVDGWAQAYTLPPGETTVRLSASPLWYRTAVIAGWLIILVSAVVAIPIGRGGRR
jgi:hypothetical protein